MYVCVKGKAHEIFLFAFCEHKNMIFLYSAIPNLTFILTYYLLIPILFLLQVTKEICRKPKTLYFILPCLFLTLFLLKELAKRQWTRSMNCYYCIHSYVFKLYMTYSADHSKKPKCVKQTWIWRHQSFYMISGYKWLTLSVRPKTSINKPRTVPLIKQKKK